ncbi:MAG: hypothetical protein Q8R98_26965 [Rubrivivax sp.]|nr:hypothetical protein [Rubrivivax sp.]MDP3615497.1 hypothetical protein [Rubrivivax sp.]
MSGSLDRIEHRYGRANRIWVMDRGIPTEDSLAKMRSVGASYLVGIPQGPADEAGAGLPGPAIGESARRRAGQAAGH